MSGLQSSQGETNYQLVAIFLTLAAISISLLLIGLRSLGQRPSPPSTDNQQRASSQQQEESSVIRFFEAPANDEGDKPDNGEPKNVGGKKVECILNGVTMQEGTVNSETVCVNP